MLFSPAGRRALNALPKATRTAARTAQRTYTHSSIHTAVTIQHLFSSTLRLRPQHHALRSLTLSAEHTRFASTTHTPSTLSSLYNTAQDEYELALDSTTDVAGVAYAAADRKAAMDELHTLKQAYENTDFGGNEEERHKWGERIAALQDLNEELERKAEEVVQGGAGGS